MARLRLISFGCVMLLAPTILAGTVHGANATSKPMPDLTVPPKRLPAGCVLSPRSQYDPAPLPPVTRPDGPVLMTSSRRAAGPLPTGVVGNPWRGSDPASVGWIRSLMRVGRVPLSLSAFGPPVSDPGDVHDIRQAPDDWSTSATATGPNASDRAADFWREQAAGLAEAYSALYVGPDRETTVLAVRVAGGVNPRPVFPQTPNLVRIGSDVVAVIEPDVTGSCAGAIKTYLTHLHR